MTLSAENTDTHPTAAESRIATRVTLIGMVLDAILGVLKIIIGVMFHSQALVVDGVHSFSDVLSDIMVLGLFHVARKEPDDDHPYGHERFETMGTVLMGSFLIGIAGALTWDSLGRLFSEQPMALPGWPVLVAAALSIVGKEWIYQYTRRVGEKIGSGLIVANAWHSRTDAFSSIVVLVGAAGAMAGYAWLDTLAAVVVALIIAKVGWDLAWDSVKELVDTALDPEIVDQIRVAALETEGVRGAHSVRSRRMGNQFLLEIHLQVDPGISVSEGHQVGARAVHKITQAVDNIRDVVFHIDAEDDGPSEEGSYPQLPTRKEVTEAFRKRWSDLITFDQVATIRLHYLGEKISVEIYLLGEDAVNRKWRTEDSLSRQLKQLAGDLHWLGRVRVWFAEQSD
ncbi:cation diffusion facilitator family transporter [Marinobacteraceae bacterium S3BR75-40.1]